MTNHTVAMIGLAAALLAFPAMAQHRIMQEMPAQFQGRWCSVEPTEATKNRDVYSRDPSGQCAGSDGEYRVFATRIVGGGVKCAVMEVRQPKNIARLACMPESEEQRAQERDKPWFVDLNFWIDDKKRLNVRR
jgi:hypothetical protein